MNSAFASALAMTVIVALRYLATSGLFAWATHKVRPGHYRGLGKQIRSEITWSLATAAIYGVPAGIVAWGWQQRGWTRIYKDPLAYPLWWMPVSLLAYLVIHDTWFYWTHRWMHRPAVFRQVHAIHHASRPPHGVGRDEFSPHRSGNRFTADPGTGVRHSDPCGHAGHGFAGHDRDGGDQSYGLGDFPQGACSFKVGGMADNGKPPQPPSRTVSLQLRPLFPLLGPALRH